MSEKITGKLTVVSSGEYDSEGGERGEKVGILLLCTLTPFCIAGFDFCLLGFSFYHEHVLFIHIIKNKSATERRFWPQPTPPTHIKNKQKPYVSLSRYNYKLTRLPSCVVYGYWSH